MRFFLQLSFDGTGFHGWQIQQNAHSVQAEVNAAIGTILKKNNIETTGCGRTDTGVHAEKFLLHFDHDEIPDKDQFVHQINCLLPNTIAVQRIINVNVKDHARFDATSRTYIYRLYRAKDPFLHRRAYYFHSEADLDLQKMNSFAEILKQHSDFSSFSKLHTQTKTNLCKIESAEWKEDHGIISFTITADRFLRNMVRAIVGTLLNAGTGKINEEEFIRILESQNRSEAGFSVPAHGLYLTNVVYPFIS